MPLRALTTPLCASAALRPSAARRGFAGQLLRAVTQVRCLSVLKCCFLAKSNASQPRCVSDLQAPLTVRRLALHSYSCVLSSCN